MTPTFRRLLFGTLLFAAGFASGALYADHRFESQYAHTAWGRWVHEQCGDQIAVVRCGP